MIRMANEQLQRVHYTVRALQCWTASVLVALGLLLHKGTALKDFYKFGPSENLVILGLVIDSYALYAGVICYTLFNTISRTLNNQIVYPWITLVIHDTTVPKHDLSQLYMHEITQASTIYTYIDWFIAINLVFSQLDIILIEFIGELIITFIVTRMYITVSPQLEEPLIDVAMEES